MKVRTDIAEVTPDGVLKLHLHAGQVRALRTRRRFVLVLAGTQGGKTSFGPYWLLEEMRAKGPGDYLVATPTFPLLELKLLPEFLRLFRERLQLGNYRGSPSKVFELSRRGEEMLFGSVQPGQPTRILFGHAQDPDSLESATIKAAWLDEAGQKKFKLGSWEAIQRRLSIHEGRVLLTTTPYTLGWLKTELHDPALKGDPDIELIQFESIMNPSFSRKEFERMRKKQPRWKFNMMYRGLFERPAGLIYDCVTEAHYVKAFPIPPTWRRYIGLDFGGVNTAAVFIAEEPGTGKLFLYRTYHAGSRTAAQHVAALKKGEPGMPEASVGGAGSEDNWRREFTAAGLPIQKPSVPDVEVGIQRVYSLFQTGRLKVFDHLTELKDDLGTYARELDAQGEPTEAIEDKATYHRLDGLRYIGTRLGGDDDDTEVILL